MSCNQSCVWFQIYSNFDSAKNKPIVKILCNRRDKGIKDISQEIKDNCEYYKTKKDIEGNWKNG